MGKKSKKKQKATQFFEACSLGNIQYIKEALNESPELISTEDDKNYKAIHFAVLAGQLPCIMVLLNWGADPNALTDKLQTPLFLAVRNGYLEITEKLIERGAEPWKKTASSKTCLHCVIEIAASDEELGVKMLNILLKKRKYTRALFQEFINTQDSRGRTALQMAMTHRQKFARVIDILMNADPPEQEYEINVLLHGWNDKLNDWRQIEKNFTAETGSPFYLFAYDSLANRVTIDTLAEDLYLFINSKLELFRKTKITGFQKKTSMNLTELQTEAKKKEISVNIICYSTGGLIVRSFLQARYRDEFRTSINRVVFLAPANMGSPFAKFGKSHVGRIYTGQKKVGSLFECGEELLTSLEPNSPFIWDLASGDIFNNENDQFFVPSEIMATIIQGTKHYPKNIQTKVTRGDMRGTDGTVTVSGASLRAIRYSMNLNGGASGKEIIIQKSTPDVALRLHPAHTHRSLIDSLLNKTDAFFLVRRALETTREQFKSLQQAFEDENEIYYSSCHTPGNLLIFQYYGKLSHPTVIPQVFVHPKNYNVTLGQQVDSSKMTIESRASLIGVIRDQFNYTEYHSRSRRMFYKIADLPLISKTLVKIGAEHPNCHISLALSLHGCSDTGRIFASTAWLDSTKDCFYSSDIGVTSMFTIAPVAKGQVEISKETVEDDAPELSTTDNSTYALKYLSKDDCLDMTLNRLKTSGILRLCSLFHRDQMLDQFIVLVAKTKIVELSGNTCAKIVRALVPFFKTTEVQEACMLLLYGLKGNEITLFKNGMDKDHSNEPQNLYDSLPLPIKCESLHQLIFTLFDKVPFRFMKFGNLQNELARYLVNGEGNERSIQYIKLGVLAAETIFKESEDIELENPMKYIVFVENTIQPESDPLYISRQIAYPGISQLLSKLSEPDNMDIVLLKDSKFSRNILLENVSYITLSYPKHESSAICQFIIEYLSLYPEYYYTIIGNSTPIVYTAILQLFEKYEGTWAIIKDSGDHSCTEFSNIGKLDYFFTPAKTWIDAAVVACKQNFFPTEDLVELAQLCTEDLQQGLMRGIIFEPTMRWEEILESIKKIMKLVDSLPTSMIKEVCNEAITSLHKISKRNYAALLLSENGVEMIIKFKQWIEKSKIPIDKSTTIDDDTLITLSKDTSICSKLTHLIDVDIDQSTKGINRNKNVSIRRTISPLSFSQASSEKKVNSTNPNTTFQNIRHTMSVNPRKATTSVIGRRGTGKPLPSAPPS